MIIALILTLLLVYALFNAFPIPGILLTLAALKLGQLALRARRARRQRAATGDD